MKATYIYITLLVISLKINGQQNAITLSVDNITEIADQYFVAQYSLSKNYYHYLYLIEKNVLLKSINKQVKQLLNYSKKAFKYGEINFMRYQKIKLEYTRLFHQMDQNAYEISIQENKIQLLLGTMSNIYPGNDSLPLFIPKNIIEAIDFHTTYSHPPDSLIEEFIEEEIKITRYFQIHDKLSFYTKNILPYNERAILEIEKKLELEEINQLDYNLMLIELTESNLKYLDVLNEYNQTAIELNYEITDH